MALAPSVWRGHTNRAGVIALFLVGLLLGGLATASLLWLLGGLVSPLPLVNVRAPLLLLFATVTILRDLGVIKLWLPENARQIPRSVFRRGFARAALQFGFELGTGVRTYVPTTLPYLLALALVVMSPTYAEAIAAGLGFGLGRALGLLFRLWSGRDEGWDSSFERWARWVSPVGAFASAMCLGLLAIA